MGYQPNVSSRAGNPLTCSYVTYQALILTMLGRWVFLKHVEPLSIALTLALLWGPTLLMSAYLTPQVIRTYSVAASAVHVRHAIIDQMRQEFTTQGDYSAATQALEMLSKEKLSEDDVSDEQLVRARVVDLTKLGEMKWRCTPAYSSFKAKTSAHAKRAKTSAHVAGG